MDTQEIRIKKAEAERVLSQLMTESRRAINKTLAAFQRECGVVATLHAQKIEVTQMQSEFPDHIYEVTLEVTL